MENQLPNLRFLKNEDFASTSIEMLQNLGNTILEAESFYVPDETRIMFQESKRVLLDIIDVAKGKIRFMRNYKNFYENGENKA